MAKKKTQADPLVDLLEQANRELLIKLITEIAEYRLDVRCECFGCLKKNLYLAIA